MKYRRRYTDHVNHERWLVSYADFITLLFAFFVVMFASAKMDQKKAARLAGAIENGFQQLGILDTSRRAVVPAQRKNGASEFDVSAATSLARMNADAAGLQETTHQDEDYAAIRAELEKALAPEIKRREVALRMQPDGLVVSLRELGFFDSGSASIRPEAQDAFGRVTRVLQRHSYELRVEGHTDTVPIHNSMFASNWELSASRATEVVKVLIERYAFAADRLSAAGYAEYRPVASNAEPQGRQLNRRVDIVIVPAVHATLSPAAKASAPH